MTDRIRHVTVILDQDTRDDDAESILNAILHIRGVAGVVPHVVAGPDHLARAIVHTALHREILTAIGNVFAKSGL
jgi:hypothetical protein